MKIRAARDGDARAIAALSGELGYPTRAEDVGRRLTRVARADDHAVYVADDDGSVVGWIHVFASLRLESEPFAELGGLVVGEAWRGRGIGRRLIERASRWARDQSFEALRVRTRAEREDAHRFYRRIGFRLAKTQRVFVLKV